MLDPQLVIAPVDSARVAAGVYSVSLLATVPFAVAAIAGVLLRRAPSGTRVLVWRMAIVALLVLFASQLLPAQWRASIVPAGLAAPLVELGRVQAVATATRVVGGAPHGGESGGLALAHLLVATYVTGVVLVLVPLARGWGAARRLLRQARPPADERVVCIADDCRRVLAIVHPVRLLVTDATAVPMATGVRKPAVVLPSAASGWSDEQLRAALLHELAHVRTGDVAYRIAAQVACALFWFHPCAWWVARRFRDECELACDDRVLGTGVRASEYGRLLLGVADASCTGQHCRAALALAGSHGLRARVARLAHAVPDSAGPRTRTATLAVAGAVVVALGLGLVELAPTRSVLRDLMDDARWEARAFAVLGLAPRPDSVAVARAAAAHDPDPTVRALASYALAAATTSH